MEVVRFLVLLSCQVVLCLLTIFGLVVLQRKPRKSLAEAQKDGYLLNFLQLELEEGGLPNWKTINSFCELVATSTQNNPPDEAMQSPQEKFDRLMTAIF